MQPEQAAEQQKVHRDIHLAGSLQVDDRQLDHLVNRRQDHQRLRLENYLFVAHVRLKYLSHA